MVLIKPNRVIYLEPDNDDVGSKVNLQVEDDCIRLFISDCDARVCLRFKSGEESFKKLSRLEEIISDLRKEMTSYEK